MDRVLKQLRRADGNQVVNITLTQVLYTNHTHPPSPILLSITAHEPPLKVPTPSTQKQQIEQELAQGLTRIYI
ncbi:MAG: hypothetical protein DRN96_08610 [Thermoproteota archaeon]|nr:MAG: hypothetical protein DRN96_08610 [Candidatus Korarchaeota archaeon]RLG51741.1 MAG: hypothetical protein DRN99_08265 [Candidatus Korarchaeota archaeon]